MIELDVLNALDVAAPAGAPAAWRSADDRAGGAAAAAARRNEFPATAGPDAEPPSRREFLKVMGASVALAGLAGCRRPAEQILPYARQPEEVKEGVANYYATAMPMGDVAHALLVESHEGRPTKVEGNPEHPVSRGAAGVFAYASILNLYDPDRSRSVRRRGAAGASWADFVDAARRLSPGAGLAILAEPSLSPTVLRLREAVTARFPGARWITLGPHGDSPSALSASAAFGRPLYRFSQARTIVSFDGDFLDDENSVWNSREYAQSRRVNGAAGQMSRLYAVESQFSTTGGMADHRRRLKAGDVGHYALAVAAALGAGTASADAARYADDPMVAAIAEDVRGGGPAVFVAGSTQPPAVHALCATLNARFSAGAVEYLDTGAPPEPPLAQTLPALVRDMGAGRIGALVMLGTNPVYSLPASLGFAAALTQVPLSIHLGSHRDESAERATWHLPRAHYLEAWGDARAYDGTLSVIQPLIAPIYPEAKSEIEVLNVLATGRNFGGYDLVRQTMGSRLGTAGPAFEDAWRTVLHDGSVPNTAFPPRPAAAGAVNPAAVPATREGDVELVFRTCPKVHDGQFSNNAWMQELPEPVTKLVWDNVAVMSPATAARLGATTDHENGKNHASVVTVTAPNGARVELPVWVQPGHPDNSIAVSLGYGRQFETDRQLKGRSLMNRIGLDMDHFDVYKPGPLANGVGRNVAPLRSLGAMHVLPAVRVEVTGGGYLLASTQDHGRMEGRPIARMATVEEYLANPEVVRDQVPPIEETPWEAFPPLWTEGRSAGEDDRIERALYSDQQWGMAIDLNACSGCNACVIACQSENNVQVVGKDQVARGREMHWLRMDRYYVGGTVEEPGGIVAQPMMCVHCENAPCESVCPVAATSHSPDGLNEMTYNRCIGTKYCSNNCPYKVRRFNFYNWTSALPMEAWMSQNPNVTVRFRGVMEKCTYCVHRIRKAQQYAHIEDRGMADGEVLTACQQACPSDAIVFGNLADEGSRVARLQRDARAYKLLEELAVRPRTSYLARLRNPHPRLPDPMASDPSEV